MKISIVFGVLCVNFAVSIKNTYRAGIIGFPNKTPNPDEILSLITETAKLNPDILVVSSPELEESSLETSAYGPDSYDEIVEALSTAAKQSNSYVVGHFYEKTRCQSKREVIRSNLVFDRKGDIVSVYRKPLNANSNCNTTTVNIGTFTTDFGITFGVIMEEDLVLRNPETFKLKNFVLVGPWSSETSFLAASEFSPSWSYITDANLVSAFGIFAGKAGFKLGSVVELDSTGGSGLVKTPSSIPKDLLSFPSEDLSQYIIRPLDFQKSNEGYKETVCHGKFCCDFFVKTNSEGSKPYETHYGLAVFNGVRHIGRGRHIGSQNCALVACAALYKRSCAFSTENNSTRIKFTEISIKGNFTKRNSAQYPVILTATPQLSSRNFNFDRNPIRASQDVSIQMTHGKEVLSFGIFGRVFSKDFERDFVLKFNATDGLMDGIYDYFNEEEMQELFDYLWVRLRVVIFVVSIYFLEMM